VDPHFTALLFRVIAVGGTIAVIGASVLLLAFRAFGRPFRANVLIAVLLVFVLVCCLILLRVSLIK
jgi:hypothetical protein